MMINNMKPTKTGLEFIQKMLNTAISALETRERNKNAKKSTSTIAQEKYKAKIKKHLEALTKIDIEMKAEFKNSGNQLSGYINLPYVTINNNYYPPIAESKEITEAKKKRDDLLMRLAMGQDVATEVRSLIDSINLIK
jgi:anion-transporting  ArsA/GET3 family ATPase